MSNYLKSMDISASALNAHRIRLDIISQNIANAQTTRTDTGGPYTRKYVTLESVNEISNFYKLLTEESKKRLGQGVKVVSIMDDKTPFKKEYDPDHPDADENGYVKLPNVDITREMLDLLAASRSYEANITALNASKSLAIKALEIGK